MDGIFYKALELMVFRECVKPVISLTLDCSVYALPVGRQDFSSINLEIQITEGQIIEGLL